MAHDKEFYLPSFLFLVLDVPTKQAMDDACQGLTPNLVLGMECVYVCTFVSSLGVLCEGCLNCELPNGFCSA
jgi:hypothetical protein